MVGGDCWFVLEVDVVVFEPVCNGMACGGGVGCVGHGALPPWLVRVEVAHYQAVCWDVELGRRAASGSGLPGEYRLKMVKLVVCCSCCSVMVVPRCDGAGQGSRSAGTGRGEERHEETGRGRNKMRARTRRGQGQGEGKARTRTRRGQGDKEL